MDILILDRKWKQSVNFEFDLSANAILTLCASESYIYAVRSSEALVTPQSLSSIVPRASVRPRVLLKALVNILWYFEVHILGMMCRGIKLGIWKQSHSLPSIDTGYHSYPVYTHGQQKRSGQSGQKLDHSLVNFNFFIFFIFYYYYFLAVKLLCRLPLAIACTQWLQRSSRDSLHWLNKLLVLFRLQGNLKIAEWV